MQLDEAAERQWKIIKFFTYNLLIAAPLMFLFVAYKLPAESGLKGAMYLVCGFLLLWSALGPTILPKIKEVQLQQFKDGKLKKMTPSRLYFQRTIIGLSMAVAPYCTGFLVYVIVGGYVQMLWFYPIGIFWSIKLWPRRRAYEEFLQNLEQI